MLFFHLAGGPHEKDLLGVEHLLQQVLKVTLLLPLAESSLLDAGNEGGTRGKAAGGEEAGARGGAT